MNNSIKGFRWFSKIFVSLVASALEGLRDVLVSILLARFLTCVWEGCNDEIEQSVAPVAGFVEGQAAKLAVEFLSVP